MLTCTQVVQPDVMHSVTWAVMVSQESDPWLCPVTIATALEEESNKVREIPKTVLRGAQKDVIDPVIGVVFKYVTSKQWPKCEKCPQNHKMPALARERHKLHLSDDGLLYIETASHSQLLLPQKYHQLVYKELHEEMDHLGVERVVNLIRDHFHWPHMQKHVENYITRVCSCLKNKRLNRPTRAPLTNIITAYPFKLVFLLISCT